MGSSMTAVDTYSLSKADSIAKISKLSKLFEHSGSYFNPGRLSCKMPEPIL